MRIVLPISNGRVSSTLVLCQGFRFYEDDHGKIKNSFYVPLEGNSIEDAIALIERYGVDALITGHLSPMEREEVAMAGILLYSGVSGDADQAALDFLSDAIVFDPNNTCNACGHGHACSMDCASCELAKK